MTARSKRDDRSALATSFISGEPRIMAPPWKWRYTARAGRSGRNTRHGTPAMSWSTPAGDTASNDFIISRCPRTRSSRSMDTASFDAAAPNISAIAVAVARASARIASYSSGHSVMPATLSRSGVGTSGKSGDEHPGATDEVVVDPHVGEAGLRGELERAVG